MATKEYRSEFARRYVEQGHAEEAARALLLVLEARGFSVSPSVRDRIVACGDAGRLERWTQRAVTISSVDELFAD